MVLTWPLDQSALSASQLVHAVASADAGPIDRVEFWVDEALWRTVSKAPFAATLDASALEAGPHRIEARAFDGSGRSALDAVGVSAGNASSL